MLLIHWSLLQTAFVFDKVIWLRIIISVLLAIQASLAKIKFLLMELTQIVYDYTLNENMAIRFDWEKLVAESGN